MEAHIVGFPIVVTERIEDLSDLGFNPYLADEAVFGDTRNPYTRIAELRAEAPVVAGDYRMEMGLPAAPVRVSNAPSYMVLSHAAVEQVPNNPLIFSNKAFEPTLGAAFGHAVSMMDPPEHTFYRKILSVPFVRPSCRNGVKALSDRSSKN